MNPYAVPPLITSILVLLLGCFVFLKNKIAKPNRLFLLETLTISLWLFFDYMMYTSHSSEKAFMWAKASYVGAIFIPPVFLHFSLSFLGTIKFRRHLIVSYVSGILFLLVLLLTDHLLSGAKQHYWGYYPTIGFLHIYFMIYYSFGIGTTYWALYSQSKDKARPAEERNKIKFVFLAFVIGFMALSDTLPKYGIEFYPIGFVFLSIWMLLVTYAIIKHRLFDIQVVISRGAAYTLTFFLGILPAAIIIYFLQKVFPLTVPITLVLSLAAVLAFLFHKIYPFSQQFVQKRLFKKRLDYYEILRKFSRDMTTALDIQNLLQRFDKTLQEAMQVSSVAVYLTGPMNGKYPLMHVSGKRDFIIGRLQRSMRRLPAQSSDGQENIDSAAAHHSGLIPQWKSGDALVEMAYRAKDVLVLGEMQMMAREKENDTLEKAIVQMKEAKAEVCVPLKRDGRMIGMALLGPRANDGYYSPEDLDLLHIVGQNACVAVQNALFVEDLKRSYQFLYRTQRFAALGELVAGLCHEIRNPLMPISYLLELIANPAVAQERIKRQRLAAWHALHRITNVLNEIEELAMPYKPVFSPTDIRGIIDEALTLLEPEIKRKKQNVLREYAALPEVMVDAERLKQAFTDLLLNAVEASLNTSMISVRTREISLQGARAIQIEIADNGCGIAPENIERVFDPFFTTKHKSIAREGTGLGLSLAHRIVEDHHGTIELISAVGKGTKVLINLPVKEQR